MDFRNFDPIGPLLKSRAANRYFVMLISVVLLISLILCAATSWLVSSISVALNQPTATSTSSAAQNLLPDEFATRLANAQNQPPSQAENNQPNAAFTLENLSMAAGLLASIVTVVGGLYAGYRVLRGRK